MSIWGREIILTINSTAATQCPNCGLTYPFGWWHTCPSGYHSTVSDELAFLRSALIQAHDRIDELEGP